MERTNTINHELIQKLEGVEGRERVILKIAEKINMSSRTIYRMLNYKAFPDTYSRRKLRAILDNGLLDEIIADSRKYVNKIELANFKQQISSKIKTQDNSITFFIMKLSSEFKDYGINISGNHLIKIYKGYNRNFRMTLKFYKKFLKGMRLLNEKESISSQ